MAKENFATAMPPSNVCAAGLLPKLPIRVTQFNPFVDFFYVCPNVKTLFQLSKLSEGFFVWSRPFVVIWRVNLGHFAAFVPQPGLSVGQWGRCQVDPSNREVIGTAQPLAPQFATCPLLALDKGEMAAQWTTIPFFKHFPVQFVIKPWARGSLYVPASQMAGPPVVHRPATFLPEQIPCVGCPANLCILPLACQCELAGPLATKRQHSLLININQL